jgi:hypothetical protein
MREPYRSVLAMVLLVSAFGMSCAHGADGYHTKGFQVAGITCEHGEPLRQHEHIHLSVFVNGQPVTITQNTGLDGECLMPLHTYDTTGVIHVETATKRAYTLGDFFTIWHQPLSSTSLMDQQVDATHQVRATVNGQVYDGDPATIPLVGHDVIVVSYGPPFPTPAPFEFPASLP